jgi:hypothetical protein
MALMQSQGVQLSLLHQPSKQWYSHRTHGTQKLLAEKSLPQIARIYTDLGGYGILPYPRSH